MNEEEQRAKVGAGVKEARLNRGWSQVRLAEEAGVSEGTVGAIEAGRSVWASSLRKVLDALGLAPPLSQAIELEGVPKDVRAFLLLAAKRLAVLDEADRDRVLARLYPMLLELSP